VVGAVVELDRDVYHLKAGNNAALHASRTPFSTGPINSLRDNASLDVVDELKVVFARDVLFTFLSGSTAQRLDAQAHVAVLTLAAGLLDVLCPLLGLLLDGLAVGHLRLADVCLDAELALHAVNQNFEVELTHARDEVSMSRRRSRL
jgi:hypothetical protein